MFSLTSDIGEVRVREGAGQGHVRQGGAVAREGHRQTVRHEDPQEERHHPEGRGGAHHHREPRAQEDQAPLPHGDDYLLYTLAKAHRYRLVL